MSRQVIHHFKHGPHHAKAGATQRVVGAKKVKYKLDCKPDLYNPNDTVHYVHPSGKAQFKARMNDNMSITQWLFGICRPKPPPVPAAGSGRDLRIFCNPIRDQGQEGSCTGFSGSAFREVLKAIALGANKPLGYYLSPADLYYKERALVFQTSQDNGATLGEGCQVLETYGICPETDMPYTAGQYTQAPSTLADQQAASYRIGTPYRCDNSDPSGIKALLYANKPVWIGFDVYSSFEDVGGNGVAPVPDKSKEQYLGGHAVLVVGFDDTNGWWIVRNSWGTSYGDQGYVYQKYGYETLWNDCWTADPV